MTEFDYAEEGMSLDEKLDQRKSGVYDQWRAVTDQDYAGSTVDENGRRLNEAYLTPGDVSRKLGCERNKLRKMITETFRDCLVDIVELEGDDSDKGLGKQSRAKTLLSVRDLEIMRIILNYKERGASDNEIKKEILNRRKGQVNLFPTPDGDHQLPTDPAFVSLMQKTLAQVMSITFDNVKEEVKSSIEPAAQSIRSIESKIDLAFQEAKDAAVENERLKGEISLREAEIQRKESEIKGKDAEIEVKQEEIERLKRESEEKIAKLEADLEDARNKKRPWFRPWW